MICHLFTTELKKTVDVYAGETETNCTIIGFMVPTFAKLVLKTIHYCVSDF